VIRKIKIASEADMIGIRFKFSLRESEYKMAAGLESLLSGGGNSEEKQ